MEAKPITNTAYVIPNVTAESDLKNRYETPMNAGVGSSSSVPGTPDSVGPAPGKGVENIPSWAPQWTIDMAVRCSEKCGIPCDWLWGQWCNESGAFQGASATYHNYAGILVSGEGSSLDQWGSNEEFADYFAWFIVRWNDPPVTEAKTFRDYIHRLENQNDGSVYCQNPPEEGYWAACSSALGNQGTVIE